METGLIDAVGHPTGRILGHRPPYDLDMDAVIEAAVRTGVALELNASPDRLDLSDEHARRARDAGAAIVIDTDAHSVAQLAFMPNGVNVARRAWLSAADVLNARPVDELREHVRRRRPRAGRDRARGVQRAGA
jgi:DNA polymerase (family 10)